MAGSVAFAVSCLLVVFSSIEATPLSVSPVGCTAAITIAPYESTVIFVVSAQDCATLAIPPAGQTGDGTAYFEGPNGIWCYFLYESLTDAQLQTALAEGGYGSYSDCSSDVLAIAVPTIQQAVESGSSQTGATGSGGFGSYDIYHKASAAFSFRPQSRALAVKCSMSSLEAQFEKLDVLLQVAANPDYECDECQSGCQALCTSIEQTGGPDPYYASCAECDYNGGYCNC